MDVRIAGGKDNLGGKAFFLSREYDWKMILAPCEAGYLLIPTRKV